MSTCPRVRQKKGVLTDKFAAHTLFSMDTRTFGHRKDNILPLGGHAQGIL